MDAVDLDHIPDNRREALESWLTHCRDINPNEHAWMAIWDERTTCAEMRALLSPFGCADELLAVLMEVHSNRLQPVDDPTLLQALQDYVAELARNAIAVGETDLANLARSVPEFRVVDDIEFLPSDWYLEADLHEALAEEIHDAVFSNPDPAVVNLDMALAEWGMIDYLTAYIMRPLLNLDLDLRAFYRLWSLGAETKVTTALGLISRPQSVHVPTATPTPFTKGRAAKEAARAHVDWSHLPTAQHDIDELTAAADAGDHPALAKLSLMYMGGLGVEYNLPRAFGLLDQAAGDYPSVVRCYEAGQKNEIAAADYGMYYLSTMGWGVPKDEERSIEYL